MQLNWQTVVGLGGQIHRECVVSNCRQMLLSVGLEFQMS